MDSFNGNKYPNYLTKVPYPLDHQRSYGRIMTIMSTVAYVKILINTYALLQVKAQGVID